jgi:hypothetical protein
MLCSKEVTGSRHHQATSFSKGWTSAQVPRNGLGAAAVDAGTAPFPRNPCGLTRALRQAAGRRMRNAAPPFSEDSSRSEPRCWVTMEWTIASPSPVPCALVVKKG